VQTITINKHWFGAALIGVAGLLALLLLTYLSWFVFKADDLEQWLIGIVGFTVTVSTVVALIVYSKSTITLSASGIEYRKYAGLFYSNYTEADWNTVQRIDVAETSIIAKLFHYGTLTVITAGDERPNLTMTFIPDADLWKEYIDKNATMGAQS